MALTLPYPDMNFVPLDVLTAAEQNQLVANIEYIANQFPVTASNVDFTTLLPRLIQSNEKAFSTAASDTAIYGDEITISETGTYFVYVMVRTYATGNTGVLFTYINRNGTNLIFTNSITANNGRAYGDIATTWTFNAGDKIKGGFYGTAALGSLNGASVTLLILRVS